MSPAPRKQVIVDLNGPTVRILTDGEETLNVSKEGINYNSPRPGPPGPPGPPASSAGEPKSASE